MFIIELNSESIALFATIAKSPNITPDRIQEIYQVTVIPPFSARGFLCQFTPDSLRIIRKGRKLTQAQLTEITGLHNTYLSRLESGYCINPGLDTLAKLSEALGCKFMLSV